MERIPNTRRLEDKLAELESKLAKLARESESPISISPALLARLDQFGEGPSNHHIRPLLPIFPDLSISSSETGFVSLSELEEGYGCLILREVVEDALLSWDPNAHIPPKLCECL